MKITLMKRAFRIIMLILGSIIALLVIGFFYMRHETKLASPEATAIYANDGAVIEVDYCRPSKKGRVIFGNVVPYGETWRTGANEATTFETNRDLLINGKTLPKGKYTLWTVPNTNEWSVIFNTKQYGWGVNMDGISSRIPQYDMLEVTATPVVTPTVVDTFTIGFTGVPPVMYMQWDQVRVEVLVEL